MTMAITVLFLKNIFLKRHLFNYKKGGDITENAKHKISLLINRDLRKHKECPYLNS